MTEAEAISADNMDALNFTKVQTLCVVDAVHNAANEPLHCEPPHTIANKLGCEEYDGQDLTQNTPTFDLNLPTMS